MTGSRFGCKKYDDVVQSEGRKDSIKENVAMMKKHLLRGAAVLLAVLLICPTFAEEDAVMQKIKTMTLREKIGQLFMIRPRRAGG